MPTCVFFEELNTPPPGAALTVVLKRIESFETLSSGISMYIFTDVKPVADKFIGTLKLITAESLGKILVVTFWRVALPFWE